MKCPKTWSGILWRSQAGHLQKFIEQKKSKNMVTKFAKFIAKNLVFWNDFLLSVDNLQLFILQLFFLLTPASERRMSF